MPLPLHPVPFKDEWLGSWLLRVAEANFLALPRLLRNLGIRSVQQLPQADDQVRLSEAGALSSAQFDSLIVRPDQALATIGSTRTAHLLPFMGVTFLQLCPTCLATDETPYIRRHWLYREAVACRIHGGPLLDRCPHCQRAAQLIRSRGSRPEPADARAAPGDTPHQRRPSIWRRRKQRKFWTLHLFKVGSADQALMLAGPDLRQCQVCLGPLSSHEAHLHLLPPEPGSPDLLSMLPDREVHIQEWQRFVGALNRMIDSFAVIDFTSLAGHRRLNSSSDAALTYSWPELSDSPSNIKTAENRFRAVLLRRLILTPGVEGTELEALRAFASALCDCLRWRPEVTSARCRYLKWLTYALHTLSLNDLLTTFPSLVTVFQDVRRNPSTCGPPADLNEFQLTEEQWALIDPVLTGAEHGDIYKRRSSMEALCLKMAMDRPLEQLGLNWIYNDRSRWNVEYWIEGWSKEGVLATAFEGLYTHLTGHQLQPDLFALIADPTATAWQKLMCAVFLSDQCIDFLVQNRTAAATDILSQIASRTPHQTAD